MTTKLQDCADSFVLRAVEAVEEFPLTKKTLTDKVAELVNDHWFEGSELSLADDNVLDEEIVVQDTSVTPFYILNMAIRKAVIEAAEDYIDQLVDDSKVQYEDWQLVLDAVDTLGIQAHWKHTDFVLLLQIYKQLITFAHSVFEYINAPSEREEACRKNMEASQPVALGLPVSTDASDWWEFHAQLESAIDQIWVYLDMYAENDRAYQMHKSGKNIEKYHNQYVKQLPEFDYSRLQDYAYRLRLQASEIDNYLRFLKK